MQASRNRDERIADLTRVIDIHREAYYNADINRLANPSYTPIPDEEFDLLVEELEELDPENSVLANVGAPIDGSDWPKVKHSFIAGSLTKVKNPTELKKWIDTNFETSNSIFWSEKIDGLTILLTYDKGQLTCAASRGDGVHGDDLYPNVIKMRGVLTKLPKPFTGTIRGEILLRKSVYQKHFAEAGYSNERNAASGVSRRYDGTGCDLLDVFCYQVIGDNGSESEIFQFQYLQSLGLQTPQFGASATSDRVEFITSVWNEYQNGKRDTLDYAIDGLVIRINDLACQSKLGMKRNRPVGATAFKFTSLAGTSIVRGITWQTGASGRITPVLEIDPVVIAGAEISRVSIYNHGYIQEMKLDVGAEVRIIRSGDVIPVCEAVIKGTGSVARMPQECVSCGGPVRVAGENLTCPNASSCPAQVEGKILNWISGLDVKEFGEKLIHRLVESKLCLTIPDLYKISVKQLSEVERMGEKSASKCKTNLWAKNNDNLTLDVFIGSLSIPFIGKTMIRLLMKAGFDTVDKIMDITAMNLATVRGFGPERIEALLDGLKDNRTIIMELRKLGVEPMAKKNEAVVAKANGKLVGKSICITGKTTIKRDLLAEMIEAEGGKFAKKVDSSVQFLCMVKEDSQTVKAKKAMELGVKIIDEAELMAMIGAS